ncbi:PGG domain [Sesbania bispinosa]|nr:PGG domain [Sesbania bispinosa]
MKETRNLEDDTLRALYEASLNGCVGTLNTLIQKNPLILNRVSLSSFRETPLHIASLLGHSEFCEALLKRKPSFASEVDSEGRCPLHLASAEGHTEVVKALVRTNPAICLAQDKDGKLPLHLAVMRGRMEAIKELTNARPESIRMLIDDGSVLHLCILYNQLEALKFLLQSVGGDQHFLLAKDKEGNTVLHLAVKLKQIKIIEYLLSVAEIGTTSDTLTALKVLERWPRDFIGLKIEDMLIEAGVLYSQEQANQPLKRAWWEKFWYKYLQYQGNWIEETRGTLMVVATVIATMAFQLTISPPGGVWQENTRTGGRNCITYGICEAGTAVLAYARMHHFLDFMIANNISFFSSLGVLLLLISGLPLNNKVMMWMLTIAMIVAVTCMGFTYVWALSLVTPAHIPQRVYRMAHPLAVTCGIWLLVVGLFHILHFIIWVKKRVQVSRRMSTRIVAE